MPPQHTDLTSNLRYGDLCSLAKIPQQLNQEIFAIHYGFDARWLGSIFVPINPGVLHLVVALSVTRVTRIPLLALFFVSVVEFILENARIDLVLMTAALAILLWDRLRSP